MNRISQTHKRRDRRIERVRQRLLRKGLPRLQITLILSLTAFAGFVTSFLLLTSGVLQMWVRYPIAIAVAYFVFLILLAFWVWLHRRNAEVDLPLDALDVVTDLPSGHAHETGFGGGGDFGGGGSGGIVQSTLSSSPANASSVTSSGSVFDLDLDAGWLIVVAIVAILGGIVASFYVIYIAPALLAEILIDGALIVGLYKRVKPIEQRHWLRAAVRRTVVPALLVALCFTIAGYSLQAAIPEAHSIGEAWRYVTRR